MIKNMVLIMNNIDRSTIREKIVDRLNSS
jgi:hypothetical protein